MARIIMIYESESRAIIREKRMARRAEMIILSSTLDNRKSMG